MQMEGVAKHKKFVVSAPGPLDPRAPRAEAGTVGCPRAVTMLLNQLANGPGRVAEHHGRGPRYASSRVPVTNFIRASEAGAPDPSGVNV